MSMKKIFADNLRCLMEDGISRITQEQVSKRSKVGQKTISNILNLLYSPQLDTVEQIATSFGVLPHEMLIPDYFKELLAHADLNVVLKYHYHPKTDREVATFRAALASWPGRNGAPVRKTRLAR